MKEYKNGYNQEMEKLGMIGINGEKGESMFEKITREEVINILNTQANNPMVPLNLFIQYKSLLDEMNERGIDYIIFRL